MKIKTKNIFDYLVRKLRDIGFSVKICKATKYTDRTAMVYGTSKVAIMIYEGKGWYKHQNESIFIENMKCFNKWSQAPFRLPYPKTYQQLNYLFGMIDFMKTKEAYECSKYFFSQTEYPNMMKD